MQTITHNNHFVPQFYLKQWSNDGIHLWSYRTLVSHKNVHEWTYLPLSGVAYQRDLYTSHSNGEEVDEFEKWLEREFENPAQDSIKRVIKGYSLTKPDAVRLATFLGSQDVRTPLSYIESMEEWNKNLPHFLREATEKALQRFEQKEGKDRIRTPINDNDQFFKDSFNFQILPPNKSDDKQGYIRVSVDIGRKLWIEKQKLLLTKTIKALQEHKWSIVYPAQGCKWFTSDHPVIRLNYYDGSMYDLKGGWGKEGGSIFMPISPNHLFFTEIGKEFPDQFTLTPEQTKKFQNFLAERSYRWIFSDKPEKFISKMRPRNVDPKAFIQEAEQWRRWHEQQSQAENKTT